MIKIEKILVPTDFSKTSLSAIRYALSLAQGCGAEVVVLHVIPGNVIRHEVLQNYISEEGILFGGGQIPQIRFPEIDVLLRERGVDLQCFLHGAIEPELLKAVKVTPLVRLGKAGEEIVAAAKEKECDLIVIASRERNRLGRLFSRSLTQQVVRLAPCPVLSIQPLALVQHDGVRVPARSLVLGEAHVGA